MWQIYLFDIITILRRSVPKVYRLVFVQLDVTALI